MTSNTLSMPPLYTLNLTGSERSVLDFLEACGAITAPVLATPESVSSACRIGRSTAYEALDRLIELNLVTETDTGYRINPRYLFASQPELRQLAEDAMRAPQVTPDAKTGKTRKMSNAEARRRRVMRSA